MDALVAALLVALAGAALMLKGQLATANESVMMLAESTRRAQAIDRLIGRQLDVERFLSLPPGDEGVLLWIVGMDGCSGCFDSVSAWNVLVDGLRGRRTAYLVVTGEPSEAARRNLRTASRDSVVYLTDEQVRQEISDYLPNTKIVVGSDGIVELADSRSSGQFCGWVFEALVARWLGVELSIPIRDGAPREVPIVVHR